MRQDLCLFQLFSSERENLYHEEGHRDAEHGGNEGAHDDVGAEQVVSDEYDGVLDEVVRDIGNREFHTAAGAHGLVENEDAVEPIGDDVAGDVGQVEREVAGQQEGVKPGQQRAIESIDAAHDEKEKEFPGEEMMPDLFECSQAKRSFHCKVGVSFAIIAVFTRIVNFWRKYPRGHCAFCL